MKPDLAQEHEEYLKIADDLVLWQNPADLPQEKLAAATAYYLKAHEISPIPGRLARHFHSRLNDPAGAEPFYLQWLAEEDKNISQLGRSAAVNEEMSKAQHILIPLAEIYSGMGKADLSEYYYREAVKALRTCVTEDDYYMDKLIFNKVFEEGVPSKAATNMHRTWYINSWRPFEACLLKLIEIAEGAGRCDGANELKQELDSAREFCHRTFAEVPAT